MTRRALAVARRAPCASATDVAARRRRPRGRRRARWWPCSGRAARGKSTLLRAVAGLQPLDAGSVRIDGRDLAGVPVHRRGVGLMFQDQALFPHRDVAGNVGFGLRMQRRSSGGRRGAASPSCSTLVGLPGAERRPVAELSGGEQQRVALARALAPSPVGAAPRRAARCARPHPARAAGRRAPPACSREPALTVVAVTHDQAEAFALADRIAVMDAGRRAAGRVRRRRCGPRPVDRRVAELLGLTNLVAGDRRRGRVADTPWGELAVPARADGPVTVVVRPTGVVLDPRAPIEARRP